MESITVSSTGAVKDLFEDASVSTTINSVLPPELLATVFDDLYRNIKESLPFPLPYDKALKHSDRHPLLDCMLVCRRWWNIVQASPFYWTVAMVGVTSEDRSGPGQEGLINAQNYLDKSGSLPLHLTIAPEYVSDSGFMLQILKKHVGRVEILNIISGEIDDRSIPLHHLDQLLRLPFLSLKRLQLDELQVDISTPEMDLPLRIDLDAPHLHQLFYHLYVIISPTPSRLSLLSISGSDDEWIEPPAVRRQIELPELVELRITESDPGSILSMFATPVLQVLIVRCEYTSNKVPGKLPEYPHLRDLQWSDVGHDATFELVLQQSPNLRRYANYVIGREENIHLGQLTDPPSVFERRGGIDSIKWPSLEEVLLDCALCDSLLKLVDLVPTIKRIRVLKDPSDLGDPITEAELLAELRQKVDFALWLYPWSNV
ncbi:hypothetical protein FS837_000891 [Tulasnella sp. UAMH 9824]|nr:hypothetical protein FS837_000891 [Tulasnella sp. UAMH 9824]